MNPISGIQTSASLPLPASGAVQPAEDGPSFKDVLLDSIREVNSLQQSADQAVEQMVTGGDVSPAHVMTAVQKADLAFRMMMQIRNKISAAYDEIKNIHI